MEIQGEGPPDKMEDAPRCGGRVESKLDEYFPVSGGDEENLGAEEYHVPRNVRESGPGKVSLPGEERERLLRVGGNDVRCKILDRKRGSYPCWNCPGGLSFSECQRLRGEIK